MIINSKKSCHLLLRSKRKQIDCYDIDELNCSDETIHLTSTVKLLGLRFTDTLEFTCTIDHVRSKLNNGYYLLQTAKPSVSDLTLKLIYNAYCKLCWCTVLTSTDPSSATQI